MIYNVRCWAFKRLYFLMLHVAPVQVRMVTQEIIELGITEMERRKK